MPGTANLAIYQGDDYAAVVTVMQGSGPADLTGYTAQAEMRTGAADCAPVAWEINAQVNPPNFINLLIPASATALMSGSYCWDLQITDPTGLVTTILAGGVTVTREITREAS
jgi:hypothetical protein